MAELIRPTAVYDACVLYPALLRDLLIRLACRGLVRAHWTAQIQDEWMRNLKAARSDLDPAKIDRTRKLMEAALPGANVSGYEALIDGLALPDPDDRHVLAAAIACRANVIVTCNLRDFPATILDPHGVLAQHPDEFIHAQLQRWPHVVVAALAELRADLTSPPYTACELLDMLLTQDLSQTVRALRPWETRL